MIRRALEALVVMILASGFVLVVATRMAGGQAGELIGPGSIPSGPATSAPATSAPAEMPAAPAQDLDAGKPTCGPITFPDASHHVAPPLDGPVADCVRPETNPGPDPIQKQAVPPPAATPDVVQP